MIEQDIENLNYTYLMLIREVCRTKPLEAVWRFGLDQRHLDFFNALTIDRIRDIASCGRLVMALVPANTPTEMQASTHAALMQPAVRADLTAYMEVAA